jgi:F-type H+-transporting ATPase subunit delta
MKMNTEQDAQDVAKLYANATREKLAGIYAKALLGAAETFKVSLKDVGEEYDSFIELYDAYPKFETILSSLMVPVEEKTRIIDEISDGVSGVFVNFLKTLARRGRMEILREIRTASRLLEDEIRGRVLVRITTAAPINETTKNNLAVSLRNLLGGEPEFLVAVDPEMIGGIIVRVGDVIYDASIATQLTKVRQDIIDRSVHEIQNRRDCFRNPERN